MLLDRSYYYVDSTEYQATYYLLVLLLFLRLLEKSCFNRAYKLSNGYIKLYLVFVYP